MTLIELVVALSLTTIVMAAATSVMFVASRALPRPTDPVMRATDAGMALALFESDCQSAFQTRAGSQSMLIRIPDRTGDTIPENITYAWAGTAGDPFTRNDGVTTSTIITSVKSVSFEWATARGNATRLGVLYLTIELDRGLILRSTVRLPAEPKNDL